MRTRHLLAFGLLLASFGWAQTAGATLCYMDATGDGKGKAMKWPTMPIKYLINASKVAAADKASFVTAVKAAFTSWTQLQCTNIQFTDGGESTSVDATGLGAILVHFNEVPSGYAYDTFTITKTYDPPDITEALIRLNLNIQGGYSYAVGAKPKMFDVQTVVKNLIGHVLGLCTEVNASGFCVINKAEWQTAFQNLVISDEFKLGAKITYFKADPGCTKPTDALPACKNTSPPPPPDGVKRDLGPIGPGLEPGTQPRRDGPQAGDGPKVGDGFTTGGDPATLPPPDEDDGCCKVGHTTTQSRTGLLALAGLGLLLALGLRRRGR